MLNGAPDLALTQFAVESLVVVLLTAVLLVLPRWAPTTRTRSERWRDAALATAFGAVIFVVLVDMSAPPTDTRVSAFYGARSLVDALGRNVVNVVLVDFRAFDTLGETTVVAVAAVIAWSLLGGRWTPSATGRTSPAAAVPFVLSAMSPVFFGLLLALSVVLLVRGHNAIGGGFVGGLTAGLAIAILVLGRGACMRVGPSASTRCCWWGPACCSHSEAGCPGWPAPASICNTSGSISASRASASSRAHRCCLISGSTSPSSGP